MAVWTLKQYSTPLSWEHWVTRYQQRRLEVVPRGDHGLQAISRTHHYTCGEDGWEAVADFALDWALAPTWGDLD
jgi:hypothetical protein